MEEVSSITLIGAVILIGVRGEKSNVIYTQNTNTMYWCSGLHRIPDSLVVEYDRGSNTTFIETETRRRNPSSVRLAPDNDDALHGAEEQWSGPAAVITNYPLRATKHMSSLIPRPRPPRD